MKKLFLLFITTIILLSSVSALPVFATDHQEYAKNSITVDIYGSHISVDVFVNKNGDVLLPADILSFCGNMNRRIEGSEYVYSSYTSSNANRLEKQIRISTTGSYGKTVIQFPQRGYLSGVSITFKDSYINNGNLYLPLQEIVPFMDAKIEITTDGLLHIYPNPVSIFDAITFGPYTNLSAVTFDVDNVIGGDFIGISGLLIDSILNLRFDRLDIILNTGAIKDYKKIFKKVLLENDTYLSAFDKNETPLDKALTEITSSVKDANDFFEFIDENATRSLEYMVESDQFDAFSEFSSTLKGFENLSKVADSINKIINYGNVSLHMVEDNREMLLAVYGRGPINSTPACTAANEVSLLYNNNTSGIITSVTTSTLRDYIVSQAGSALTADLKPYAIAFDAVKLALPEATEVIGDASNIYYLDAIVCDSIDAYNNYYNSMSFDETSLNDLRLSLIMALVSSKYSYDLYYDELVPNTFEDGGEGASGGGDIGSRTQTYSSLDQKRLIINNWLEKLYLASDSVKCSSTEYYNDKRLELSQRISYLKLEKNTSTTYNFLWPVKNGKISWEYISGTHKGIDIVPGPNKDKNIYAARDGKVRWVAKDCEHIDHYKNYGNKDCGHYNTYGNVVGIEHSDGTYSIYGHLAYGSIKVWNGKEVKAGEIIGTMGSSGKSTGTHLHFEVRIGSLSTSAKRVNVNSTNQGGSVNYTYSGYADDPQITPSSISNGTYYFNNDGYRMYMKNDSFIKENASVEDTLRASNGNVNSTYQFVVEKKGSYYKIHPKDTKHGYVVNCFWGFGNSATKAGNHITLYYDEGGNDQRFIFEEYNGGYLIHPADSPSLSWTRNGDTITVEKTTKAANQIWTLETEVGCSHEYVYVHQDCDWTNPCDDHWQECTKCGDKLKKDSHNWSPYYMDNGGILSLQSGHIFVCDDCGLEGLREHVYDHSCDAFCNVCNRERSVEHVYDNACDPNCNLCGVTRTVSHSYISDYYADAEAHWNECSVCHHKNNFSTHNFVPVKEDENTYLTSSVHLYRCSVCGFDIMENHIFDDDCDAFCNVCGGKRVVYHNYKISSNRFEHWRECIRCGHTIDKSSHSLVTAISTQGHWQYCSGCDYKSTTIAHTFTLVHDDTHHWYKCDCGYRTDKTSHLLINDANDWGHWVYCSECDYQSATMPHTPTTKYSNDQHWQECPCGYTTSKANHSINYYVEDMEHIGKCTACNYTTAPELHDVDSFSNAQGHWWECCVCDYVSQIKSHAMVDKIDTKGHWQFCSTCNYGVMIAEHTFSNNNDDNDHWKECACGYTTGKIGHTLSIDANSAGHWFYCVNCDYKRSLEAHTLDTKVIIKDASCTQEGEMKLLCSVCGHEKHSVIPKNDHNYTTTIIDDYKHFICTMCGHTYKEVITDVPPMDECTNHSYSEWITITEATCKSAGEKQQVCSNCGHTNTEVIEKENHLFGEWHYYDVVDGSELEYRSCKNCGEIDVREKDTPSSKDEQNKTLKDYLVSGCSSSLYFSVLPLFAILTLTGIALFKKKHI